MAAPVQVYSYCDYIQIVLRGKPLESARAALLERIIPVGFALRKHRERGSPRRVSCGIYCRAAATTQSLQLQSCCGFASVAPLRKGLQGNRQAQVAFIFVVLGISPINHP
jgi:hypothetical protein